MNNNKNRILFLTEKLALSPHPEGGFYKETYRSKETINENCLPRAYTGSRDFATSIYFLLTSDSFSAFHKINQDEIWHFYEGSPIELHIISLEGKHKKQIIGPNISKGEVYQLVVPQNHWFASKVMEPESYALVGCTVAPGFDFADFTLAERSELTAQFPHHEKIITAFTRV
ncbi:MAG: cupin domain-containing protein [Bacteroidota bacterium]